MGEGISPFLACFHIILFLIRFFNPSIHSFLLCLYEQPAHMHGHGQNHGSGRPPMMPAGQHTGSDVRDSHIHEFAPIRANPYQRQQQQYRHDHHHHHPLPPRPNAGDGPRCNSVTSANSTDQSEQSYDVRSHGASYSGVNHMLGQLHAQRRNRQQQHSQQLQQPQQPQPHPPTPGHQRRNTLSPNWGLSSNVAGGNGDGGTAAMSAGQHPGPLGGFQQMRPDGQQQGGGRPHPQGQGNGQSRQRVPSWRRKVQLPSSSNLY